MDEREIEIEIESLTARLKGLETQRENIKGNPCWSCQHVSIVDNLRFKMNMAIQQSERSKENALLFKSQVISGLEREKVLKEKIVKLEKEVKYHFEQEVKYKVEYNKGRID